MAESRRLNSVNGITGVLLCCDGNFMQYFEGEEDAVVETCARIRASKSHLQLSELMNQAIVGREFGDWAVGFSRPSPDEFIELAAARWRGTAQTGPGASLLRLFWASCRLELI